ncbi:hypothetical protein TELCIR_08070 [Teladorsagia circumcincta]|uniref:DUF7799 domain-containing protein n=1 Tax=Teladorsagia circumcincta TaxID=45464 RepID=A0A2G9UIS4_TELCI|nr:hypothetical protein TELCIR_08070 [Teladorsagia circumcincta]
MRKLSNYAFTHSMGYVEVRIDEMTPGLLEIGESASETANLLHIHDDLLKRLAVSFLLIYSTITFKFMHNCWMLFRSHLFLPCIVDYIVAEKEDQVAALLTRTDNLSAEKDAKDAVVYDDMAKGLREAWRGLQKQLMLRGYLLRETLTFYRLGDQHEKLVDNITRTLKMAIQTENGHDAAASSRKADAMMNGSLNTFGMFSDSLCEKLLRSELIDTTAQAMDVGSSVITQIRALGPIADNPERDQQMLNSCVLIEKTMLRYV